MNPIDTILARAEAATEEPWETHVGHRIYHGNAHIVTAEIYYTHPDKEQRVSFEQGEANLKFILHARKDIPRLCRALKVAREEHEAIQSMGQDEVAVPLIQAANRHYWRRIDKIIGGEE